MRSFYLVWNPRTGYTKYKHSSYSLALEEAKRLARENGGSEFLVLEAISSTIKNDVVTVRFTNQEIETDDLPF